MAASATRATIGLPSTGSSSLLRGAMREERPAASTMAAIFALTPRLPFAALHGGDLGDDREGDLGRALRADIEADRGVNARRVARRRRRLEAAARRVWHASSGSPARRHRRRRRRAPQISAGSSIFGSWVSAISAVRRIQADLGQRLVGPFARRSPPRRSARSVAKARARIDDHHLVAERACHRHQRLRHMHGADDDQADRRIEHVDEDLAVASRQRHAAVAAKRLVQRRGQIRSHIARRMGKASRAACQDAVTSATFRRAATSPMSRGSTASPGGPDRPPTARRRCGWRPRKRARRSRPYRPRPRIRAPSA